MKIPYGFPAIIPVLVTLLFFPASSTGQTSLYHQWVWEFSIGGFSGRDTLTPRKAGHTRKIEFTKNGKFREFLNDSLVKTCRFIVRSEKTIFSADSLRVIRFADSVRFSPQVIWKVTKDTLELGDNHVEPFGHRYIRSGK